MAQPDYAAAGAVYNVSPERLREHLNICVGVMSNDYGAQRVLVDDCYKYCSAGDFGDRDWNRSIPVKSVHYPEARNRMGDRGAYSWAVGRDQVEAAIADLTAIHGAMPVRYQIEDWRMH